MTGIVRFLFLAAAVTLAGLAQASGFPERPVKLVVPYGVGGGVDSISRLLAEQLGKIWGQSVVVENRPGAGAIIGTQAVTGAAPDGYTLLMAAGTLAVSPSAYANLPYDVTKDLAPITTVAESPYVLTVNAKVPARNVQELIELARRAPDELNFGTPGKGTLSHLSYELFQARTGVQSTIVHYKGSPAALNALLAGQVDVVLDTPAAVRSHIQAGSLRGLAVSTAKRSNSVSDIPTMMEAGVKDYDVAIWFGLMAPAGTPDAVLDQIHADTLKALADPTLARRYADQDMIVRTLSRQEFADLIQRDIGKWAEVVKQAGIKFE